MKKSDLIFIFFVIVALVFCAALLDDANAMTPSLQKLCDLMSSSTMVGIIVVFLSSILGFSGYKKQKMRDELNRLYLEEGFERLITYLTNCLNIVETNFASALYIVRDYRDVPEHDFLKYFNSKYKNRLLPVESYIDQSYYRTGFLLKNDEFKELMLKAFASFRSVNEFNTSELPLVIKKYKEKPLEGMGKGEYINYLNQNIMNKKAQLYFVYSIVESLEIIHFRLRILDLHRYEQLESIIQDDTIRVQLQNFAQFLEECKKQEEKTGTNNSFVE